VGAQVRGSMGQEEGGNPQHLELTEDEDPGLSERPGQHHSSEQQPAAKRRLSRPSLPRPASFELPEELRVQQLGTHDFADGMARTAFGLGSA